MVNNFNTVVSVGSLVMLPKWKKIVKYVDEKRVIPTESKWPNGVKLGCDSCRISTENFLTPQSLVNHEYG